MMRAQCTDQKVGFQHDKSLLGQTNHCKLEKNQFQGWKFKLIPGMIAMRRIYKIAIINGLLLFVFLFFDMVFWPGSKILYIVFSSLFTLLLYLALKHRPSVGFVFFAVALWIGFWLKLSIHVISPALPWMEPIGLFDFSQKAWDSVVLISSVGVAAVIAGGFCFSKAKNFLQSDVILISKNNKFKLMLWIVGLSMVVLLVLLNEMFDIAHQAVPPPVLDLPFRLQGLFNWCLSGGAFIFLMIPLYREVISGYFVRGLALVILAGLAVAITMFSRGTVVVLALAISVTFFVYRDFLPRPSVRKILECGALIVLGVVLSVTLSQARRATFLDSVKVSSQAHIQSVSLFDSHSLFLILKLPIERWIGLEGVMAISAYPGKGLELLNRAIKEPRQVGIPDMYTYEVALSPMGDLKKVVFSTPPSIFAFWYYSGSLLVVFIGVSLLTIILLASELIILNISKNPFLSGLVGLQGAMQFIHMGTGGLSTPAFVFFASFIFALMGGYWSRSYISKLPV